MKRSFLLLNFVLILYSTTVEGKSMFLFTDVHVVWLFHSHVVFVWMFTCGTDRRRIVAEEPLAAGADIRWFSPSTADGPSNQ